MRNNEDSRSPCYLTQPPLRDGTALVMTLNQ